MKHLTLASEIKTLSKVATVNSNGNVHTATVNGNTITIYTYANGSIECIRAANSYWNRVKYAIAACQ